MLIGEAVRARIVALCQERDMSINHPGTGNPINKPSGMHLAAFSVY